MSRTGVVYCQGKAKISAMKENIKLVISTTDREPAYIHRTLASLFLSGPEAHGFTPVHLMVGSPDERYLGDYAHSDAVHVHPLGKEEWRTIRDWGPHRRCCHNYHRCLTLPLEGSRGLVVCEDDLIFQNGFYSRLLATVDEIEAKAGVAVDYALAAYAAYDFRNNRDEPNGELFCPYGVAGFYGSQCVYYPRNVIPKLAELVLAEGVKRYSEPLDMLVKAAYREFRGFFACRTSLVQHIGERTTGLGGFHQNPTFDHLEARKQSGWAGAPYGTRLDAIRTTRPLFLPQASFPVHLLTCHKDLDMALWCLKSFMHFSEWCPTITIHDDGSLTKADGTLLQAHLPGCRVIPKEEADRRLDDVLRGHPRCRQMRQARGFHTARKLFDPWAYCSHDALVIMDSDILFFRRPQQLLEHADRGKACFGSDYQNAYAVETGEIRRRLGVEVLDRINSGLLVLGRNDYDLDLIEDFFGVFPETAADQLWLEQTLYALLLSRAAAQRLDPAYQISSQPIEAATVSHHFVSDGSREHFSTRGVEALRQRGFPLAIRGGE